MKSIPKSSAKKWVEGEEMEGATVASGRTEKLIGFALNHRQKTRMGKSGWWEMVGLRNGPFRQFGSEQEQLQWNSGERGSQVIVRRGQRATEG